LITALNMHHGTVEYELFSQELAERFRSFAVGPRIVVGARYAASLIGWHLIAPLASLAPRGSRFVAAYFVGSQGQKACPFTPPQHGGRDPVSAKRQVTGVSYVIIQQWP
jgi:hypothetical protein